MHYGLFNSMHDVGWDDQEVELMFYFLPIQQCSKNVDTRQCNGMT